jgi:ABC-2 type transport system permease protein
MNGSVLRTLILSDWRRHRSLILLSIAGGLMALALIQLGGPTATVLGSTWFFVSLVVLGSMLPSLNVINERKKQTLPFLLSFPISVGQYTAVKLLSTVGMFFVPWVTLVIAAMSFIVGRQDIPNGLIPGILVLAVLTFIGFCVIAGAALASESEGLTIAATVATNSSYGFGWYLYIRNPLLRTQMGSPVAVWSPEVLKILSAELAAIVLILGVTFYLQSRKRDFV